MRLPAREGPLSPRRGRPFLQTSTARKAKIFGGEQDPGQIALPVACLARGGGCSRPACCDVVQ